MNIAYPILPLRLSHWHLEGSYRKWGEGWEQEQGLQETDWMIPRHLIEGTSKAVLSHVSSLPAVILKISTLNRASSHRVPCAEGFCSFCFDRLTNLSWNLCKWSLMGLWSKYLRRGDPGEELIQHPPLAPHLCFTILETPPAQDSVGPRKHSGSVGNANRPERPLLPFKPELVLLFNWEVKIIYIYGVQLDAMMCLHCGMTKSGYSTRALPYIFCHLFMVRTLKIYSLRNRHTLSTESRQWYPKKLEWPRNPGTYHILSPQGCYILKLTIHLC